MKIEIELVEVEALRNQVNQLARENQELREEIENISPEKLKARAARLAHKIFDIGSVMLNGTMRKMIGIISSIHVNVKYV